MVGWPDKPEGASGGGPGFAPRESAFEDLNAGGGDSPGPSGIDGGAGSQLGTNDQDR